MRLHIVPYQQPHPPQSHYTFLPLINWETLPLSKETKFKRPKMISLKAKSVLITGGSRGLGAATAHAFANEGANILVNYVSDEASAANVVAEISDKHGVKADAVQGDVGVEENRVKIVKKCIALFGGVDVIVSNAVCSMIPWRRFGVDGR